jgi:hypothetical protein
MSEKRRVDEDPPESQTGGLGSSRIGDTTPPQNKADTLPSAEPVAPKKLTAEEQMALYEETLKEEDWGHQPC